MKIQIQWVGQEVSVALRSSIFSFAWNFDECQGCLGLFAYFCVISTLFLPLRERRRGREGARAKRKFPSTNFFKSKKHTLKINFKVDSSLNYLKEQFCASSSSLLAGENPDGYGSESLRSVFLQLGVDARDGQHNPPSTNSISMRYEFLDPVEAPREISDFAVRHLLSWMKIR
ncbi:hypothetical protein EGR_09898 [Echinococcus granulosus]|uniref:Uncharacterized protein n=1 Tax=Echinococcus granulosus TaxID=6210 RepID=W6U2A1_ECHGR|nr:hypothetical protein EGR_09898 [Echinococcus granulosus]EUB55235.1 hypothetical protein EGR_09898 [Echinococcus granulosus]